MADLIKHRGPDSDGYYTDDNCALGFRRLSIIDLDGGTQPIYNDKNDYPETANPVKLIVYDIEPNGLYIKTMTYKDGRVLPGKQERI